MKNQRDDFQLRKPRGRQLFEPFKPLLRDFGRAIAFGVVFLTGSLAIILAEWSSPGDHRPFWHSLWLTLVHAGLAALYFRRVRDRMRWLGLVMTVLAAGTLIERALRLFLGIRLFG